MKQSHCIVCGQPVTLMDLLLFGSCRLCAEQRELTDAQKPSKRWWKR